MTLSFHKQRSVSGLLSFILIILLSIWGCDDSSSSQTDRLGGVQGGFTGGIMGGLAGGEQDNLSGGNRGGDQGGSQGGSQGGDQGGSQGGGQQEEQGETLTWQLEDQSTVSIQTDPFQLQILPSTTRPSTSPITLGQGDLGLGLVDTFDYTKSYDPYWLHHLYLGQRPAIPYDLSWAFVERIDMPRPLYKDDEHTWRESPNQEGDEPIGQRFRAFLNTGDQVQLDLVQIEARSFTLQLTPSSDEQAAYGYWQITAQEDEEFYGLGESFDHVARRGSYRALNFQVLPNTESGYNEAHIPVPLLISTQGHAYFFESDQPIYFDVAYEDPNRVRAEVGRPSPLKLHLLWAEHPFETLDTYYELTARPLVPPYWAFAPHYWRNVTTGQEEVENDLLTMRQLGIPGGVFWIDRPYQRAYNDCVFDPNRYEDPHAMRAHFAKLGYKMVLWHAPYTSEASDAWEEANEGNYFIGGPLVFLNFGKIMDFTNPNAMDLWARLLDRFNQVGVDGYKLDYGEDVQVGFGGNRLFYSFHDGSDELTMHHRYATFYHRAYLNTLPLFETPQMDSTEETNPMNPLDQTDENPHLVDGFILGRSSTYGGQQYVHALWPGDLDSDFRTHLEDHYWVGGMPAGVIAGLTLASSGFPFFAADTGGFRNDRPTQEVLIRWAWQTAFSAIMQVGGGGTSHFPWAESAPSEPIYDEQGIQWMKEAAQWNLRLSDYRFTYGLHARRKGIPLLRPFGLAYPEDGRHPNDVYLLGPDLLVAPIFENETRSVPLPQGQWIDFWTNELIVGPATVERTVPLGSQALFLRQGALIPLLDSGIQTLTEIRSTNEENNEEDGTDEMHPESLPPVRSLIDQPGGLRFLVVPGQSGRYVNHEGSQIELDEQSIILTPAQRFSYFELDLRFDVQETTPSEIRLDQTLLMWIQNESEWQSCQSCVWLKQPGQLWIRLPPHQNTSQYVEWIF